MKKEKNITQPKKMNKVNTFISKINNLTFVSILLVYTAILLLVVILISPKYNYVIVPNREHITQNDDIYTQLTLKNNYTYSNNELSSKLSILAKLSGNKGEGTSDPNYTISSFKLGAYTTNKKMEYFTEQSGYKTTITHSYSLNDSLPEEFFINITYKDNGEEKKIATYEDIFLEVGNNQYVQYDTTKPALYTDVTNGFRVEMRMTSNENNYLASLRLAVDKLDKDYHMDVQTWVVPEDNVNPSRLNEMPLIGIYGYSSDTTTYSRVDNLSIPRADDLIVDSSYIYCKVHYYEGDSATPVEVYYKFKFSDCIGKAFSTTWASDETTTGEEVQEAVTPKNDTRSIIITCVSLVVAAGVCTGGYFLYNKKKVKKEDKE